MTRPVPECVFLDLDDTVYPPETGLWEEIGRRINRYLVERMAVPERSVDEVRRRYFETYGTTCNGLRAERHVDPEEYYRFVHDIPLARFLSPDPELRRMLTGLGQRRYIFSNADRAYILSDGHICCQGNPRELLQDIKNFGYEECARCRR